MKNKIIPLKRGQTEFASNPMQAVLKYVLWIAAAIILFAAVAWIVKSRFG